MSLRFNQACHHPLDPFRQQSSRFLTRSYATSFASSTRSKKRFNFDTYLTTAFVELWAAYSRFKLTTKSPISSTLKKLAAVEDYTDLDSLSIKSSADGLPKSGASSFGPHPILLWGSCTTVFSTDVVRGYVSSCFVGPERPAHTLEPAWEQAEVKDLHRRLRHPGPHYPGFNHHFAYFLYRNYWHDPHLTSYPRRIRTAALARADLCTRYRLHLVQTLRILTRWEAQPCMKPIVHPIRPTRHSRHTTLLRIF